MTGGLWALVAGMGFGVFQAFNRRAVEGMDVYVSTFIQLLLSAVILAAVSMITEDLTLVWSAPPGALVNFGVAGFFHFFLGWTFLNASQKRIGAARTSSLVGTTPLFGTVIAALALQELPGPLPLAGVVLTVVGVYQLSQRRAGTRSVGDGAGEPGAGEMGSAQMGAARMDNAVTTGWRAMLFGSATPLCWAISPIFIRHGLRGLASPLLGVTVGMAVCAGAYGVALVMRGRRSPAALSREALGFKLVAGILVGLSTWARWVALDLAPVAVVLALSSVSVPTVILLAPLLVGQHLEQVTARVWLGAILIIGGSLLLLFFR